jgi:hypothetical protein
MDTAHSVSIESGSRRDGSSCFFIKLQGADCEVNVTVSRAELNELLAVRDATWLHRHSLRAGDCLGSPAFWSVENGRLSVLLGADAEAWEVGFTAPESLIDDLLLEIERVRAK